MLDHQQRALEAVCPTQSSRNPTAVVKEILEILSGPENPANLPSRGLNGNDLVSCKLWWNGPNFIRKPECEWPEYSTLHSLNETAAKEIIKQPPTAVHSLVNVEAELADINLHKMIDCERFNSLTRLLRVTAYVLRFVTRVKKCLKKNVTKAEQPFRSKELTSNEVIIAEIMWIRNTQTASFSEEFAFLSSKSPGSSLIRVRQFGLSLDNHKVIRCKGRLKNTCLPDSSKNPVLLPSKHRFVDPVIRHVHERVKHSGIRDTLTTLRERYRILRGREVVKRNLKTCFLCRKLEGAPYQSIPVSDLPSERVSEDPPPFTHTGLDFAGPLVVRNESSSTPEESTVKAYVCLYSCASTRAVHLELTQGLSTESFLRSFRRFMSRRGLPATLISDNAKTFKSASKEIRTVSRSEEVQRFLTSNQVTWNFIVERAPWWGGFWERLIGSVKRSLKKILQRATLSYEKLIAVLAEVESIINSRPITYIYDDDEFIS